MIIGWLDRPEMLREGHRFDSELLHFGSAFGRFFYEYWFVLFKIVETFINVSKTGKLTKQNIFALNQEVTWNSTRRH